jgi:prespore-specific regulator
VSRTRSDAWNDHEDYSLAQTVLTYIRQGNSQLDAFDRIAEKLGRTSAACGFRWNNTVRKDYKSEIEQAKHEKRTKRGYSKVNTASISFFKNNSEDQTLDYNSISKLLLTYKKQYATMRHSIKTLSNKIETSRSEIIQLQNEREGLLATLSQRSQLKVTVTDDYQALLAIIKRANMMMYQLQSAKEIDPQEKTG